MGRVLQVRQSRSGIYHFHILNHWFVIWKFMYSKEEFYHNKYCFLKNIICELVVALQSGRAILSSSQPMALELFPIPISKVCLIKQTLTLGLLVITKKPQWLVNVNLVPLRKKVWAAQDWGRGEQKWRKKKGGERRDEWKYGYK